MFSKIKKLFFTPAPEAPATLKTESSSSREVAILWRRVSALEQEKEQREGEGQEQKKKMDRLLDESMRINNELLKSRKKKRIDAPGAPVRQLHQFAAKEGLEFEYNFLEPSGFKYERVMRFMKKKELIGRGAAAY